MGFNVTIQNIGKLEDANIRIGQFTVLAGPNNTGKSTVSKLLYSVFDAMNDNHALIHFRNLASDVREALGDLEWWPADDEYYIDLTPHLSFLDDDLQKMESQISACTVDNVRELDGIMPTLRTSALSMLESFSVKQADCREEFLPEDESGVDQRLRELDAALRRFCDILTELDGEALVVSGLQEKIHHNLLHNFQVPDLASLKAKSDELGKIGIANFASYELRRDDLALSLRIGNLRKLQQFSRVLYLESANYWKFKTAFEDIKSHPRFYFNNPRRKRLSGIPEYIFDLFRAAREGYTGEAPFGRIVEKLTSKQVMNGKLVLSENGEMYFQENDRVSPLSMTAMGVLNIGVLAFLIERRILEAGTFLFIDEPESNLHPKWQHTVAETLLELARLGVHIVIATHSPDILKSVEVHLKRHPEDRGLVAVNCFPPSPSDDETPEYKLARIQGELSDPYAAKYFEGL